MEWDVLALGSNGSGQLGIGHVNDVADPTRCLFTVKPTSAPKKVVAGGNHALMLFEDGSVYATGSNADGRCGLPTQVLPITRFTTVSIEDMAGQPHDCFKDVACTWEASIFLTSSNQLFTCGSGSKGELGLGPDKTTSERPQLLAGIPPNGDVIECISAGMSHVVIITSAGAALGWGAARKGQLGEPSAKIVKPRKIGSGGRSWNHAVCGRDLTGLYDSSSSSSIEVLGEDKYAIARNTWSSSSPVKLVSAGWCSIYVLLDDGSLLSWGRNDHGELAPGGLPKVRSVAAGSEHVLAETEDGMVIAWGWGEHGNCGQSIDTRGDVKDRWNVLEKGTVLGAGCATSWMTTSKQTT